MIRQISRHAAVTATNFVKIANYSHFTSSDLSHQFHYQVSVTQVLEIRSWVNALTRAFMVGNQSQEKQFTADEQ